MREGLHKILANEDTIVAISTPFGRGAIGVIRISGPDANRMGRRFLKAGTALRHRVATVGQWLDLHGEAIDDVVATLFAAPHSYTGEDVLEISAHGNPLILNRIVQTLQESGIRLASPGEFTLRAVSNGKMDLVQAEAVRDFIDAQTDAQARTARQQLGGALSRRLSPLKSELVDIIAHLEAGIDFADDDVAPPDSLRIAQNVCSVLTGLQELQATYNYGRRLRQGIPIVLVGKPNVGKSSLFNRLISENRAIVTDVPGTTRDVLSEISSVEGVPLRFFDTAGLRETTDQVESIGVTRSLETLTDAELVLAIVDGSETLTAEDQAVLAHIKDVPALLVINKSDLEVARGTVFPEHLASVRVSAKTGAGLEQLLNMVKGFLGQAGEAGLSECVLTSARQNDAVLRAIGSLQKCADGLSGNVPHEMVALDLYDALAALNELTGDTVTEDILGRIFATFCVGK